jgi:chlorite dismutase
MFHTLQLTIQKKQDGNYTKTYRYFLNDLKKMQYEINNDNESDLKGFNYISLGNQKELYIFFISPSTEYLQTVKNLVNQRLKTITDKNQERNIYKFTEGRIVDYNNGKNLNN